MREKPLYQSGIWEIIGSLISELILKKIKYDSIKLDNDTKSKPFKAVKYLTLEIENNHEAFQLEKIYYLQRYYILITWLADIFSNFPFLEEIPPLPDNVQQQLINIEPLNKFPIERKVFMPILIDLDDQITATLQNVFGPIIANWNNPEFVKSLLGQVNAWAKKNGEKTISLSKFTTGQEE